MALRDQPYLPLYVDDYANDERLKECDAGANGVYIRIMLLMHKSLEYGKVLLEQKYQQDIQQTPEQIVSNNMILVPAFATKFARHFPYTFDEIQAGLIQLLENNILIINGHYLIQKRMVKDGEISDARAKAGKSSAYGKGGVKNFKKKKPKNTSTKPKSDFVPTNNPTMSPTNTGNEIDNENGILVDKEEEVSNNMGGGTGEEEMGEEEKESIRSNIAIIHCNDAIEIYFTNKAYDEVRTSVAFACGKIKLEELKEWAKIFNIQITGRGLQRRSIGEWAGHFAYWVAKTDRTKDPRKLNPEYAPEKEKIKPPTAKSILAQRGM